MPVTFNYNDPPLSNTINGKNDPTSQRFEVGPGFAHHNFSLPVD